MLTICHFKRKIGHSVLLDLAVAGGRAVGGPKGDNLAEGKTWHPPEGAARWKIELTERGHSSMNSL